jgi:hypothetical protein
MANAVSDAVRAMWLWASCVAVGKPCNRGQAVWPRASYVAVGKLHTAGELCGRGRAV